MNNTEHSVETLEREFVRQAGERMRSCWIKTDDLPPEEVDGNVILANLSRLSATNCAIILHYSAEFGWFEDNTEGAVTTWDIADCSEWLPIRYLHEDSFPEEED